MDRGHDNETKRCCERKLTNKKGAGRKPGPCEPRDRSVS